MRRRVKGPEAAELEEARKRLKARRKLPELERRREATQATIDKFKGKPLDWSEGRHCVKLAHYHLRQMGWRSPKLPTLPAVKSPLAAKKAMKERGWDSVPAMLDSVLGKGARIPAAMMLTGDMAVTPGDEGFDCVMICIGPRTMMGFLPDGSEVVAYDTDYRDFTAAWRVR